MKEIIKSERPLSEQQALNRLGVNNFREISKNNILEFMSTLPEMDHEVAIKAIEQFPEFSKYALGALSNYKETLIPILQDGKGSAQKSCEAYAVTIDSLKPLLEKDDLTFEQKMEVAEKMKEMGDKINEANVTYRTWLAEIARGAGTFCVTCLGLGAVLLGIKVKNSQVS